MHVGIIDADLLDKHISFPNLALMKLSAYHKRKNDEVSILFDYSKINNYDKVYIAKVFDYTKIPIDIKEYKNLSIGGSGFFFDKAPKLQKNIEHIKPDYDLYLPIINIPKRKEYYLDYSIGFTTRGCFRKCDFCINKNCNKVSKNSNINEFLDINKPYICLLDDNIFGYLKWEEIFRHLKETNKPFQFKQGLDIRLLTEKKAIVLANCKYKGDHIFAFDDWKERKIIEEKIKLWRKYNSKKQARFYVLTGYKNQNVQDIKECFYRIELLGKYGCVPYVMRHANYKKSIYSGLYTQLAAWTIQVSLFKRMPFKEFCILRGMGTRYKIYRNDHSSYLNDGYKKGKAWRDMEQFEKDYPKLAKKFFNTIFFKENK